MDHRDVHGIEVTGEFGVLKVRVKYLPSPDNPKTSYIAVLSAIATIEKLTERVSGGEGRQEMCCIGYGIWDFD